MAENEDKGNGFELEIAHSEAKTFDNEDQSNKRNVQLGK